MGKKRYEIYYVVGSKIAEWIEKIFKRKELQKFKTQADLLEKEVGEKIKLIEEGMKLIEEGERILKMLYSGDVVRLTHHEKVMVLDAIEYVHFKNMIELPDTKAYTRITWRSLREKIKLHIKADPVVDEIREAPEKEPEVKEDDETKAGEDG